MYLLLGINKKRWIIFGVGLATGLLVDYFYSPSEYAQDYPWKFGVGSGITFLILLLSQIRFGKFRIVPETLILMASVLNFYFGYRSLGLICGLTTFFLYMHRFRQNKTIHINQKFKSIIFIFILIVGIFCLYHFYEYTALSGILGEEQQQKFLIQSSGKFGILLGGRNELLASGQAIIDSPILGHGSWAKNPYYTDMVASRMNELGYEILGTRNNDLIPTHSYLFGSWVEAGIFGGIFWLFILYLNIKLLYQIFIGSSTPDRWILFCLILLSWDILFSPLGAEQRIATAYHISILILSIQINTPSCIKVRQ